MIPRAVANLTFIANKNLTFIVKVSMTFIEKIHIHVSAAFRHTRGTGVAPRVKEPDQGKKLKVADRLDARWRRSRKLEERKEPRAPGSWLAVYGKELAISVP